MRIIENLDEWLAIRQNISENVPTGFVPTMGNLHQGHVSLINKSIAENTQSVVSIFVNPTQFNDIKDFKHYPKTLDADLKHLEQVGIDYCILPREADIYPQGYRFQIQENLLCQRMEGKHRQGHFSGVLTIVMKLLSLVRPTNAYFGEKDYQQYLLIRDMAKDFFMNTKITACPTIREASNLALSSRNGRLNETQKKIAEQFAKIFHQGQTCEDIIAQLQARNIQVEYIEEFEQRRFAAIKIGEVRLIDNYALNT